MINEPLVEVPKTVLPPPNSAASQYMNKSLSASQRLLFPEAHFLLEMANEEDKRETEKEELGNTEEVAKQQTEEENEAAKIVENNILSKIIFNTVENLNEDEDTFEEVNKMPTQKNIKMYKCRRCKFTTGKIQDLVSHTQKKHTCQYKCRVCKQSQSMKIHQGCLYDTNRVHGNKSVPDTCAQNVNKISLYKLTSTNIIRLNMNTCNATNVRKCLKIRTT